MKTKICCECKEELTLDKFSKNKHQKDGFYASCKKCNKNYYDKNKEKIKENVRKYKEGNIDIIKIKNNKYKQDMKNNSHFKFMRIRDWQVRKARKLLLPCTFTSEEWEKVKLYFENKCSYCGKELPLEQEHFISVTHKGGYIKDNIIPSCKSCNCSKNDSIFEEWYPKYKYYDKEREARILEYINNLKLTNN